MKLFHIHVFNFKSIRELSIPIKEVAGKTCFILLGKNESGKSSILQAISCLGNKSTPDYNSLCNKAAKQKSEDIRIYFHLKMENPQFYLDLAIKKGIPEELAKTIKFEKIIRCCTISERGRLDFFVLTINENPEISNYVLNSNSNQISSLKSFDKINNPTTEAIKAILGAFFEPLTKESLENFLQKILGATLETNTPKPVLWESQKEKYLIREKIDLNTFKQDPDTSMPLRNIFLVSGYKKEEIVKQLEIASKGLEEREELQEILSEKITAYLNARWKEHKVNVRVIIENGTCSVMIEDKDNERPKYKIDQRSDGFKQFFSILLNLSVETNTEMLSNSIIVLDEPETHLHPSGIKYLRDELLQMSLKNIVFIATHSIYMVDKKSLERHLKVEKENSETKVKFIEPNNPYEEEVIYEALGTSIYEHVSGTILLVEGKIDKDLIWGFTEKLKQDIKPISLNVISTDGVHKIPQYAKFINNTFVHGFALTDSDIEGRKIKEQIKAENKSFSAKNTFEINDIKNTNLAATIEDLFPINEMIDFIQENYKLTIPANETEPFLKTLERFNKTSKDKLNIDDFKEGYKNRVLQKISSKKFTKKMVVETYPAFHEFIQNLHKNLKR